MPISPSLLETPPSEAPHPATARVSPRRTATGSVLVATAGDVASDGAVRLAWQLAGRTGGDVQVVTALEPTAPTDVRFTVVPPLPGALLAAERDAQLSAVHAQLERALPDACDWPVATAEGPGDEAITCAAIDAEARVILLGRGRHGVVGRVASGETVLRLLRRTNVPVYAVEPDVAGLARRVVIALDFSPYSLHAARVALDLIAPDASVTLAHVRPGVPAVAPALTGWEHAYERALPELFDRARREIAAPESMQVETVTLSGRSPGRAVAGFAAAAGADLVVSATHGHGFVGRLVLGGVAAELLRHAPCSFLCVPGSAATRAATRTAARAAARTTAAARLLRETVPSTAWKATIGQLSAHHAGRHCALTIADAVGHSSDEIGSLPMGAVAYMPAVDTVVVTFGAPDAAAPLTYVVRGVTRVDRHVDADGVDRMLEVVGADGSVALRFT